LALQQKCNKMHTKHPGIEMETRRNGKA
jgi:hypothetical protein